MSRFPKFPPTQFRACLAIGFLALIHISFGQNSADSSTNGAQVSAPSGTLQPAAARQSVATPQSAPATGTGTPQAAPTPQTPATTPANAVSGRALNQATSGAESLLIGPGDELDVMVYNAPDLSGHARVNSDGNISIPVIGYTQVAGLTSDQAEQVIQNRLRETKVVNNPQVTIYVKEYYNSGIYVVGEVAKPGFYSALGPHRLFDVLQAAGGPTDKAANKVVINHTDQKVGTTLPISKDPAEMMDTNVDLRPGDTVLVPRAGIVYALGEITHPGGYVLNSTGGITVLQIVAAAGGPTQLASPGKTRLLRRTENGFQEEKVDLKKLLRGKIRDVALRDQDILFIPGSGFKSALNYSQLVTTVGVAAIYHVPF